MVFPATPLLTLPSSLLADLAAAKDYSCRLSGAPGQPSADTNVHKLLFDDAAIASLSAEEIDSLLKKGLQFDAEGFAPSSTLQLASVEESIGKYAIVRILKAFTSTLRGVAVAQSSIQEFQKIQEHVDKGKKTA